MSEGQLKRDAYAALALAMAMALLERVPQEERPAVFTNMLKNLDMKLLKELHGAYSEQEMRDALGGIMKVLAGLS